jgi:two-component system, OmpR family, alkaline phosphatase synthesis response regulator PhoP
MSEAPARVLIADDEPSIVASLEFLMRRNGYETRVAVDGAEALAQVGQFRPRVVILDVMLPKRSGLDVCREIRARADLRGTRVLILTARGGEADLERGMEAGADGYMVKPFSTHDLVDRVKALMA